MQHQKNELVTIKINNISSDANGVGRLEDGLAVFVPLAAPGDLLEVRLVKVLKHYAFGRIEKIITPSPDRIEADCPVFSRCGGCALRHISYDCELQVKHGFVRDALIRLGGFSIEPEPIVPSPQITQYRNKAQYPVQLQDNKVVAGFYQNRTHTIIPTDGCALQPDIFNKLVETICRFCKEYEILPYDEASKKGLLRHIYIRYGEKSKKLLLCLVINGSRLPKQKQFIQKMAGIAGDDLSIVLNYNNKDTNVILGDRYEVINGSGILEDILCDVSLRISPAAFYQVNHDSTENLYRLAAEYACLTGQETLLDLYCGIGSIGLSMAKKVSRLIGVEVVPQAIEDAKKNAAQNSITNAEFYCADAAGAAKKLADDGVRPDVVILDPPRKGCDQLVLDSMIKMQPDRVVMVSCNVSTMARDCRYLADHGYTLAKARGVDLFPRTAHVECVIQMEYSGNKSKQDK